MRRRTGMGVGLAIALLLAAADIRAEGDPTFAEGRARFNEGIKLAEAGDHDAARIKFDQAWTVLKAPAVLFNLARSEQLSGRHLEALLHYRAFTKLSDPKISDAMRQQ